MPILSKKLPPIEKLCELFILREDGRLINKVSRTSRKAGDFADHHVRGGYRTVYACGSLWSAHRVVWAISCLEPPPENIDHINGNSLDNRPGNLRAATHSQNMRNKKVYKSNSSGVKGVHYRKDNGMWRSYITLDGKRTNLGQYATKDEAIAAIDRARLEMHGEFARAA